MSENNTKKSTSELISEMTNIQKKENSEDCTNSIQSATGENIENQIWTPELATNLSFGILLFGLIVITTMSYLLNKGFNPKGILRLFSVPLIIVSAIFLVVAGYGEKQIAPVIGLLGTIAGYLLGSTNDNEPTKTEKNKKTEE